MSAQLNLLTVDLEEWYVVEALRDRFDRDDWDELPSTVVRNSRRLLELFDRHDVRATWFILGWAAERHPELIREIARAGHEIACHSYAHVQVSTMTPESFRADTQQAMDAIGSALGFGPTGYRAPSWSINDTVSWAFEVLADLGFVYDSSIFPIKHDLYGMPHGPRDMFRMKLPGNRTLIEIPASTYRRLGQNVPIGGGGYLRHSPYWYSRRVIRRLNEQGRPVVMYMHPWEFDPDPPKVSGLSFVQRYRTYGSTATFLTKLDRLLGDFNFTCLGDYIGFAHKKRIGFERD